MQGAPPQPDPPADGPADPLDPPSALYILGDSLSDVGNAAGAADFLLDLSIYPPTLGLCNPADVFIDPRPCDDLLYRQSRVTDGPVAVEYLAAHFELAELVPSLHFLPSRPVAGTVYAVSGATARGSEQSDLSFQVDMLLLDHLSNFPTEAVFVVAIGGNDAIDAFQAELEPSVNPSETSAAIVADAVTAIGENLARLLDAGARRLVVSNVPELAMLPAVRTRAVATGDEDAALSAAGAVTEEFNTQLAALLDEIEASGRWLSPTPPDLMRFDLRNALLEARDAIAASGGNVTEACFDNDLYRDSPTAERAFHPDCAPVEGATPRFEDFLFWDDLHPSGAAHGLVGAALAELFPES
jgi:phospholipase/lecithinase/hemolysin